MYTKTLFKTTAIFFITITLFLLITHAAFTATNEWSEKGLALGKAGHYKEAIEALTKAIELNPKDVCALNNRGVAYKNLGNYEQAIQDYSKAIELNPKDAGAYDNRGVAYYYLGNYEQAIQDYSMAIDLNQKDAGAYKGRGVVYYNLGNYKQAIQNYDKAIESNTKDEYNYLRSIIAGGYLSKEERTTRLEQLSRYVGKTKSDAWVRTISMYYLEKITEKQLFAEARQGKNTKETNGRFCEAYYYVGEVKLFNKNRKGALDYFTKAVETGVDNFIEYSQAKAAIKRTKY